MDVALLLLIAGLIYTYHFLDQVLVTTKGFKIIYVACSLATTGSIFLKLY